MARFEHENKVQRKELKPEKKWNPPLFGIRNPLRCNPESSTRDPESTAWNPESKTVLDSLTWGEMKHEGLFCIYSYVLQVFDLSLVIKIFLV